MKEAEVAFDKFLQVHIASQEKDGPTAQQQALMTILNNLERIATNLPNSAHRKSEQVSTFINNTTITIDSKQLARHLTGNIKAYQYIAVRHFLTLLRKTHIAYMDSVAGYTFFFSKKSQKQTDPRQLKKNDHKEALQGLLLELVVCTYAKKNQDFHMTIARLNKNVKEFDLGKERATCARMVSTHTDATDALLTMLEKMHALRTLIYNDQRAKDLLRMLHDSKSPAKRAPSAARP